MNKYSKIIASLLVYNDAIRGTLEYLIRKDDYVINMYDARKRIIVSDIENQSALKICLDNSGEQGQKVIKQIHEFIDDVYSSKSTIVQYKTDRIYVDHNQNIELLEKIILLHEVINDVVNAHVDGAIKNQVFEADILKTVLRLDELYYRGFAYRFLLDELDHSFAQYGTALKEANGRSSSQSEFYGNKLRKLDNLVKFSHSKSKITSYDYYEVVDPLFALIDMIFSKRDLPKGKSFGIVITELKKNVINHLVQWEEEWKKVYIPFINKYFEEIKVQTQQEQQIN